MTHKPITVDITPESRDKDRDEMLWDSKLEALIGNWKEQIEHKAGYHDKLFRRYKRINNCIGVPAVLIPVILSTLTSMLAQYPLVSSLLMLSSGMIAGVQNFFNYGSKSQKHNSYASFYDQLNTEIEMEMHKHKRFRDPADVYIERIFQKLTQLNATAPP